VPRLTPAPEEGPSAVAGALGDSGWSQLAFAVLGTSTALAVRGGSPGLLIDARQLLDDYDRKWNPARPESLVAQIEAAEGTPVPVDDDTFSLVEASVAAAELTDGAVGSEGLELNAVVTRVGAPEGSVFDVDDLARARVADAVAEELVERGAAGAVVDVGGVLRLAGSTAEGTTWAVEIGDPPVARFGIAEGAVATIGHPTRDVASATVLADRAVNAIVWAAAGDVAGIEASGLPALVVTEAGEHLALNGVDSFLR
jgi:thiamine biosynthesis lipoprotein ApbE